MREPASSEALALRDRMAQLDGIARAQAERIAELAQRLREKEALIAGLRHHVQNAAANDRRGRGDQGSPPPGLLDERPAQPDRLQAISGIGPVLERVLNDLGIYRFGQLARLTPDNIEWLACRIDWFPQRIQREDWVGQAQRLHRQVHPEEEL
jgi:predicted flap endonuclease-1-like 5' DNA nuclease